MSRYKNILFLTFVFTAGVCPAVFGASSITSKKYVDNIVTALSNNIDTHVKNTNNPHTVTASQVGLGNVKNVDQTNASNLTSGKVGYNLLPVGTAASTVAAGNDSRFDTISTTAPTGNPPSGRVYIWFN